MSRLTIGRDTTVCMSLAARPGTFGSRFHNHLYEALGLDWIYKAFTTSDLPAAISGIRALGIRGCAISMPFKEACIPLLDELAPSARAVESVNTIVNESGKLIGHNTDYAAVRELLAALQLPSDTRFALRGSGGMAKAVAKALCDLGFHSGVVVARNTTTGPSLAKSCDYGHVVELSHETPALLINATPIGMAGGVESSALPFTQPQVESADVVFDVVAMPAVTPLLALSERLGKKLVRGSEVLVLQGLAQFTLYTGITPSEAQVRTAASYALQS